LTGDQQVIAGVDRRIEMAQKRPGDRARDGAFAQLDVIELVTNLDHECFLIRLSAKPSGGVGDL
jgi:hypothetical protein